MKTKLLAAIFLTCLSVPSFSQKTEWLVFPGKYSDIEFFAPNMYKVHNGKKIGIIDNSGKVLLPAQYDAVNLFYEGRAIFVQQGSHGWQIMGVLNEDGSVEYTNGEYYVIPKYMFFSEGYLTVMDGNGNYGYLDEKMNPVFEFTPNKVTPFSEGWAAVGEQEDFYWLTADGEKVLLRLPNGGTPFGGTCTYNGKTYTWDQDGVCFVINSDGKINKISESDIPDIDYLNRSGSGMGKKVPYQRYTQTFQYIWKPRERDGMWSYVSGDGKLLSPFIYDEAEKFSNDVALASQNGKKGMLHVVADNETFYTSVLQRILRYSGSSACKGNFRLSVPEKWNKQNIKIVLRDKTDGTKIPVTMESDNTYSFVYNTNKTLAKEEKAFSIEISSNDVELWRGEENFTFVQNAKLTSRISVNNATANANDLCSVTALIKNPSGMPVTTTVTLSGGGSNARFNNKTIQLTIPPYSTRSVTSSFTVKKVELNGWCSVTVSDGIGSKKSHLELAPF